MFAPVLDLLHAHGDSTKSLRLSSLVPFAIRTYFVSSLSSLVPFAIRTYFVSSVRKSASYLGEGIQVYTKADCSLQGFFCIKEGSNCCF